MKLPLEYVWKYLQDLFFYNDSPSLFKINSLLFIKCDLNAKIILSS